MVEFAVLRHAQTAWNAAQRIQGQTDIELNDVGRAEAGGWRVPARFSNYAWVTSPLTRCRQTARLLGADDSDCDLRLLEMHWGEWEGRRISELRAEFGQQMTDNEQRGLDFRPVGGESPRDVQNRVVAWMHEVACDQRHRLVVTHKGVIRSLLAYATGWDMVSEPPIKLDWQSIHVFVMARNSAGFELQEANISMAL